MSFFARFPAYKYGLAIVDFLTVAASLYLSFHSERQVFLFPDSQELIILLAVGFVAVLIIQSQQLYKVYLFGRRLGQIVALAKSVGYLVVSLVVLSFFVPLLHEFESPRVLLSFTAISFFSLCVIRVGVVRTILHLLDKHDIVRHNVLILGATETGRSLAVNLFLFPQGIRVVGFIDDEEPLGKNVFADLKVVGRVEELPAIMEVFNVHEIVVCLENTTHGHLIETLDKAVRTGARVKISSPLYQVVPSRMRIERYGKMPVVNVSHAAPSTIQEIYKRAFDLVVGSAALVMLSPLFVFIAAAIKLNSPGPIIYSQMRVGRGGKLFKFYKFRSMQVGSDNDESRRAQAKEFIRKKKVHGASTKIVNESLVTSVGKWLRKSSIDELPQLFNVIRGEMSLVGPRPCLPYEWDHYEDWHKRRLSILPGCTGVWQVSGRSAVGFDDMVVLDLYYLQNISFLLDVRLIARTIPVMLFGTGAK
ncbi:MAG TPA: sugar transferase [Bacteroidota bacterium]